MIKPAKPPPPWEGISDVELILTHGEAADKKRGGAMQYRCRASCFDFPPSSRSKFLAHVKTHKHFTQFQAKRKLIGTLIEAGKEIEGEESLNDGPRKRAKTLNHGSAATLRSLAAPFDPDDLPEVQYRDPTQDAIPPQAEKSAYGGGMDEAFHFDDAMASSRSPSPPRAVALSYNVPPPRLSSAIPDPDSPWYPWPSREYYLVDLLVHAASARISKAQLHNILSIMKEVTPRAVPSLYQLQNFHMALSTIVPYFTPRLATATSGRKFHILPPQDLAFLIFRTSQFRAKFSFLAEQPTTSFTSSMQGEKALRPPRNSRSPMVRHGAQTFFIDELAETIDHRFVLLDNFYTINSIEMVTAFSVERKDDQFVYSALSQAYEVRSLLRNAPIILKVHRLDTATIAPSDDHYLRTTHPAVSSLRQFANGRDWAMVRIVGFADDLSGTGSKRSNPHLAASLQIANFPASERRSLSSFYPFTVSKNASPLEIIQVLQTELDSTLPDNGNPVAVRDCLTGRDTLVSFSLHHGVHDGPMRSIMSSTTTSGIAAHPCSECNWGGFQAWKKTLPGLKGFYQGSSARTPAQTRRNAQDYLAAAADPLAPKKRLTDVILQTGTVDLVGGDIAMQLQSNLHQDSAFAIYRPRPSATVKRTPEYAAHQKLRTQERALVKDEAVFRKRDELKELLDSLLDSSGGLNALFEGFSGFNPHTDLPPEPLHVILLGVVKYLWRELVNEVKSRNELGSLAALMASLSHRHISESRFNLSLWTKTPGSMVGKDLKVVAQLAPFLALVLSKEGIIPESLARCWFSLGRLLPPLLTSVIYDLDPHLDRLDTLIKQFILSSFEHDLDFTVLKVKYHDLCHLPSSIRRFGPLPETSAEGSEALNKFWRARIINSNQQATSRDATRSFGILLRLRYLLCGGRFEVQAQTHQVAKLPQLELDHPQVGRVLRDFLMLRLEADPPPFTFAAAHHAFSSSVDALDTTIGSLLGEVALEQLFTASETPHRLVATLRAANGDIVSPGDFVLLETGSEPSLAQYNEALAPDNANNATLSDVIVAFSMYRKVGEVEESGLVRYERDSAEEWELSDGEAILAAVHTVHDCLRDDCAGTVQKPILEERMTTTFFTTVTDHGPDPDQHILLNTAMLRSFHTVDPLRPSAPSLDNFDDVLAAIAEDSPDDGAAKPGGRKKGKGNAGNGRKGKTRDARLLSDDEEQQGSEVAGSQSEEEEDEDELYQPSVDMEDERFDSDRETLSFIHRAREQLINRRNGDFSTDEEAPSDEDDASPFDPPAPPSASFSRRPGAVKGAAGVLRPRAQGKRAVKASAKLGESLGAGW